MSVFAAAFLIIFSRRPDAILNAQFFAEDGQRWFADAYQFGARSLLIPDEAGGYMHTVPRLAALLALAVPFRFAPLIMNLCAIAVQILPVNFFLSSRFSIIGLPVRLLASFLYLALPNTYELNANATTIQWHLGLLACLVLFAKPASGWKWCLFDAVVLALISLESPIGVVLVPVAGILWYLRKHRQALISFGLLVPGAVVQVFTILRLRTRQSAPNGATLHRLIDILGRQVFLGSLLGKKVVLHFLLRHSAPASFLFEAVAIAIGLTALLYALRYAPVELKLFILFAFAVLGLSITHPIAGIPTQPEWELLAFPGTGNRYYFLPMIAFIAALVWMIANAASPRIARSSAGLLLALLPIGITHDWRYPPFADLHFRQYASQFDAAPSGTKIVIPINPVSAAHWTIELTKH